MLEEYKELVMFVIVVVLLLGAVRLFAEDQFGEELLGMFVEEDSFLNNK